MRVHFQTRKFTLILRWDVDFMETKITDFLVFFFFLHFYNYAITYYLLFTHINIRIRQEKLQKCNRLFILWDKRIRILKHSEFTCIYNNQL